MKAYELHGVGKRYVKYDDTPMLISRAMRLRSGTKRTDLWAIRGVDFTVPTGSSLGVIGRNGSGKSTLLRMLAGVTAPTEGTLTTRGRVAPLLGVGVGFHPELTGRENVYVNGTILGIGRAEMDRRFDEIVDFAGIGDFLDTPVKFYSSGMFVRLGFSVAVCARPEILLVDEVLAVGDIAFQLKCFDRMQAICDEGTTVVVVSHNLSAVRRLAQRCLVIHDGTIRFDGEVDPAISLYHELLGEPRDIEGSDVDDPRQVIPGVARIESVSLSNAHGVATAHIKAGEDLGVRIVAVCDQPVAHPVFSFALGSESAVAVYAESSYETDPGPAAAGQRVTCDIRVTARLTSGSYTVTTSFRDGPTRLAVSPPSLLYVSGRDMAKGIADLQADITVSRPE